MADNESDDAGDPPCLAHQLVDGHVVDPVTMRDVAAFRRAKRSELIAERPRASAERARATAALIDSLADLVEPRPGGRIAAYWPIRGEPDLRSWLTRAHAAGARILLPVIETPGAPLAFRDWSPGCRMRRGLWNIPEPAGGETARPDTVIAPLVGIDDELYRLGNGGGYYDRTLSSLARRPRVIGIGFASCRLQTIYPMPWDIPMDATLLSDGTVLTR